MFHSLDILKTVSFSVCIPFDKTYLEMKFGKKFVKFYTTFIFVLLI